MALAPAQPTGVIATTSSLTTGQGTDPISRVQVSFDTDITRPPVWTDITPYVRGWDYQRGRQWELEQFQTGTAVIVLDSNDGRFRPENTIGPYYGYLTPLRRVRVIAEYDGTVYPLWAGFAETWEPTANEYGKDLVTTLHCSDQFKAQRYLDLNQTLPAALSGARIRAALAGPKGYDVLTTDEGTVTAIAQTFTTVDPVSVAQTAAACEQGFLYCDEQGRVRFDSRNYRNQFETQTRIVFGDGTGEMPYSDPVYNYNDERLYTEVRIKPGDTAAEQIMPTSTATDPNVLSYGKRTLAMTLPIQNSVTDATPNSIWAAALANYLWNRYKNPGVRLDEITVNPYANAALWPKVLSTPLGGRLTVRQRPGYLASQANQAITGTSVTTSTTKVTGTNGMLERSVFVERIGMSVKPGSGRWVVKYGLSDASSLTYWVLGDSTFGILGQTTRLGL